MPRCPCAAAEERHLILVTATPHSGNESAFYNLLSLLKPAFGDLQGRTAASDPLRQDLARHFVQRRRKDIEAWQVKSGGVRAFPKRLTTAFSPG